MGFKVAIAAQRDRMVTQHFGRASVFHVFERCGDGWELLESRKADPTCGPEGESAAAHDAGLARAVDLVSDCDGVLAARIGPGAVRRLNDRGVEAYAMHALIEDALTELGDLIDRENAAAPATASPAHADTEEQE